MADCKYWWNLSNSPRIHSEKCSLFRVLGPGDSGFIGPIWIASEEEQKEFLIKVQEALAQARPEVSTFDLYQ